MVKKPSYYSALISWEAVWLFIKNRGEEGKGGYRFREEVSSINLVGHSERQSEPQGDDLNVFEVILVSNKMTSIEAILRGVNDCRISLNCLSLSYSKKMDY